MRFFYSGSNFAAFTGMQTAYEILGVGKTASADEIKSAYRKLAKKFHPDLNPGNKEAEKRFKEINQANEQVGAPEARAKYDRGETEGAGVGEGEAHSEGRRGPGRDYYYQSQGAGADGQGRYSSAFQGMDEDLFESIFNRQRKPTVDENFIMEIDFKDSILGATKEITLPNGKRLSVKIPPGIETGKKLRFAGISQTAGDVFVEIKVKPSDRFRRLGKHIEIEIPISIGEALLGAEVKIPTLEGEVLLKVPPEVNSGQKLRVAGKGVPAHGAESAGDEHVILKIISPKKIDAEFKAALEAWQLRQPYQVREEGKS